MKRFKARIGEEALRTDQVLTSGQLLRLGVNPDWFPSVTESVRLTSYVGAETVVTFHALRPATLEGLRARQLAHLAGVAEMRLVLGVPPGPHWQVSAHLRHADERPDAVWTHEGQTRLIEFDSCDYPRGVVERKVHGMQPKGPLYWGTTSALRVNRLAVLYPRMHVMLALWWQTPEERAGTVQGAGAGVFTERNALGLQRNARRYGADQGRTTGSR